MTVSGRSDGLSLPPTRWPSPTLPAFESERSGRPSSRVSEAGKARIAAAQKARWAAQKKATKSVKSAARKSGPVTVSKAITSAGDFTDFANHSKIWLIRANGDRFKLNLDAILAGEQPDPPVFPGDQIEVGRRIF